MPQPADEAKPQLSVPAPIWERYIPVDPWHPDRQPECRHARTLRSGGTQLWLSNPVNNQD